ncbi:MAG: acyl-CoA dehydrogenase [Acidiphilium sp.]|nr:acyl-CoA dehydrogenase [Acidiphilium sp.]MDD4936381.1 acyl-CoA dehydrogenase [Acidiphilium sp.]
MSMRNSTIQTDLDAVVGRTFTVRDVVSPHRVAALAATLDVDPPADGSLPLLWHWVLFQDWQKRSTLGPDGHPARGGFMPAIAGMERRMWAGSAVLCNRPLRVGEAVERRSTIAAATLKHGRTGALAFVQIHHDIGPPGESAITETLDVVYRAADDPAVGAATPSPVPPGARTRSVVADALTLFRYSAATGNSHRIHYDFEYVTNTEHYPGLVVHGPLQATWLADFARTCRGDAPISYFACRARRAAFAGTLLTLSAIATESSLDLALRDADGTICMTGSAR